MRSYNERVGVMSDLTILSFWRKYCSYDGVRDHITIGAMRVVVRVSVRLDV